MLAAMSLGLYLHIPFCASRCRYCAFYSGEPLGRRGRLVEGLVGEMAQRRQLAKGPATSVYFGGGTPSLLGAKAVARLLDRASAVWGLDAAAEVTLEANPGDSLDLAALRRAGVTRLSLGVQALDDRVLAGLGRRHTAAQARTALAAAVRAGFDQLSADLLLGLPDTSAERLAAWVGELVTLGAGHLSLYSLELHPGTELAEAAAAGEFRPADPELEAAQYDAVCRAAAAAGLAPYEVSNFARPGQCCRHNLAYWSRAPYLGLGPGAHSFLPASGPWGRGQWNDPGLEPYLDAVDRGQRPPGGGEDLTREQALLERLFLDLRRTAPVAPRELASAFGIDPGSAAAAFGILAERGLFRVLDGGRLGPTAAARRRADGLAVALCERLLARR